MPIPEHILLNERAIDGWMFNTKRIEQETKFSLLPRRCYISGKRLWFKRCEVVTSMVSYLGNPTFETYWCDPKEFLFYKIKNG